MEEGNPTIPNPRLYLNVFLASPGDVDEERKMARKVMGRLPHDAFLSKHQITINVCSWDGPGGTAMEAGMTPQESVAKQSRLPSKCDIVVAIFSARIGTPLPKDFNAKPDGSAYRSGTEWEYLEALQGSKENGGRPTILVYRSTVVPVIPADDPDREEKNRQWDAVVAFFREFCDEDGSLKGGYNEYADPAEFEKKLENNLKKVVNERLEDHLKALEKQSSKDVQATDSQSDVASDQVQPALKELHEIGALILRLHCLKCIADRLRDLYINQYVAIIRSRPAELLSAKELESAADEGEEALEDIRDEDIVQLFTPKETKRIERSLEKLQAAVEELSTTTDADQKNGAEAIIRRFTKCVTSLRAAINKFAQDSWMTLNSGKLDSIGRLRDQLSGIYPVQMARVDEGYKALTLEPPLFGKCNLLAQEHKLIEQALKHFDMLESQLDESSSHASLTPECNRIKGFLDGAEQFWNQFLAAIGDKDDWASDLRYSGPQDWKSIQDGRSQVKALLDAAQQSELDTTQLDIFRDKLAQVQRIIEDHFQSVDEALAAAFAKVKNHLGEAITSVPPEAAT